ncbi:nucleolar protein 8-like [Odontomachus brunneus]|uniref:nucleolar protein 8-like n=1 Tax=Odontomachus brunneus TaxID=486640 RepID=UPI0013F1E70F|nr:nucleolar protein 8-like [Odontomachus brunneus]XP_032684342.1 nucleolar protein 8-like [Odontomachus brunneus]
MSVIDVAEWKRLQSLKEKKQIFQKREQIIQKALANLYNITNNKKIIFDNNFGEQQDSKPREKEKVNLFEDDSNDNNEDPLWDKNTFNTRKYEKVTLGHDTRFTLDERFVENDYQNKTKVIAADVKCDLQKEKKRELDILESVLGAPLTIKSQKIKISKERLIIRYDPSEKKHSEYEITSTESETKKECTKKKKCEKTKIEEPVPIKVSKDIYYTVSDTLIESLRQNKEFSLLKACGRENDTNVDDRDAQNCNIENFNVSMTKNNNIDGKYRFHFSANNMFKHDSFDNEDENEIFDLDEQIVEQSENNNRINSMFGYKDTLFFENDDVRFNEAMKFFNVEVASNDEFKNLRRELKVIVRTKIRRNEKKYQPWSKKKTIKKL